MTLHVVAKRENIPPGRPVEITVENDRMATPRTAPIGPDRLRLHSSLLRRNQAHREADDRNRRERMLEVARRCPVHKTLTSEIHIDERL